MLDLDDTICAPATASGAGLRGVIRVSGPRSLDVLGSVLANASEPIPTGAPRRIAGEILLPSLGAIEVHAAVWPTSRSYTRQPSLELHFPANRVIEEAIIGKLLAHGARLARPGEFTLRAFLAGRIDLGQAEAVLAVIHAESSAELETGLRRLAGGIFGPLHAVREDLLCLLADIEAGLDFVEEDIEFVTQADTTSRVAAHLATIEQIREQIAARSAESAAWRVVLVGAPNAGKSSLFNALVGREAAIVSPRAGTTRDVVEAIVNFGGQRVALLDLAGLDANAEAQVDTLAQRKAEEAIGQAHLVLHCRAADEPRKKFSPMASPALEVWTKSDLQARDGGISTSAATGAGIEMLRAAIADRIAAIARTKADTMLETSLRSAASLDSAAAALHDAATRLSAAGPDEAFAIDLRLALDHLGEITGAVVTDDILDRVFSRFCIGK